MTPEEFQQRIREMREQFGGLFDRYGLKIIGNVAVSWFKKNFQNQAWGRVKWKEVQRRTPGTKAYKYNAKHHPARTTRLILTGDTGDLGRSIEIRQVSPSEGGSKEGQITIWTNPSTFGSKQPYGRIHNEGGIQYVKPHHRTVTIKGKERRQQVRGYSYKVWRRQFMGEHPELDDLIIRKLEEKLKAIAN